MTRARPARRALPVVLPGVLLLALAGLTACGGGSEGTYGAYCDEVHAQQDQLTTELAGGPGTGLIAALPSFQALADKAPADITDDWAIVLRRVTALQQALQAAGVDPVTYDAAKPPPGLGADDKAAITAAASGLLTSETDTALAAVQQEARDVCQTPLSR